MTTPRSQPTLFTATAHFQCAYGTLRCAEDFCLSVTTSKRWIAFAECKECDEVPAPRESAGCGKKLNPIGAGEWEFAPRCCLSCAGSPEVHTSTTPTSQVSANTWPRGGTGTKT